MKKIKFISIFIFVFMTNCSNDENVVDSNFTKDKVKNRYYTFCYFGRPENELAELDLETGQLTWTGIKLNFDNSNNRGFALTDKYFCFLNYLDSDLYLNRYNLETKKQESIKVSNLQGGRSFHELFSYKGKYYTFCYYGRAENELAELDLETGQLIWTGIRLNFSANNERGFVLTDKYFCFLNLDRGLYLNRYNLDTKKQESIKVSNLQGGLSFDELIVR